MDNDDNICISFLLMLNSVFQFSRICLGLELCGRTLQPRCRLQRNTIWAGLTEYLHYVLIQYAGSYISPLVCHPIDQGVAQDSAVGGAAETAVGLQLDPALPRKPRQSLLYTTRTNQPTNLIKHDLCKANTCLAVEDCHVDLVEVRLFPAQTLHLQHCSRHCRLSPHLLQMFW